MITSNALGHFMHVIENPKPPSTIKAIRRAMNTIQNAHVGREGDKNFPATQLLSRPDDEPSLFEATDKLCPFSSRVYAGNFHADHLIPATFFKDKNPAERYADLDFSYIHDSTNSEHDELMMGMPADWYSIGKEVWLGKGKDWKRVQKNFDFTIEDRREAANWLASRLRARCER